MNNELLKIDYTDVDKPTVLGRDLHEALEVQTAYKAGSCVCVNTVLRRARISTCSKKMSEFRQG